MNHTCDRVILEAVKNRLLNISRVRAMLFSMFTATRIMARACRKSQSACNVRMASLIRITLAFSISIALENHHFELSLQFFQRFPSLNVHNWHQPK